MSIFEKIDTARHRRDINLCKPVSQPDATGFSLSEPDTIPGPSASIEDSSVRHSVPVKTVTPIASSVRRFNSQTPAVSKSTEP